MMVSRLAWWLIYHLTRDRELSEISKLRLRHEELNIKLMETSAELIDAKDTLRQWRAEIDRVADPFLKGHNLCQIDIPHLIKNTIDPDYSGPPYPNTDGITPEEFGKGCIAYQLKVFGKSTLSDKPPE